MFQEAHPPAAHMKPARACERRFYLLTDANFKGVGDVHRETVSQHSAGCLNYGPLCSLHSVHAISLIMQLLLRVCASVGWAQLQSRVVHYGLPLLKLLFQVPTGTKLLFQVGK